MKNNLLIINNDDSPDLLNEIDPNNTVIICNYKEKLCRKMNGSLTIFSREAFNPSIGNALYINQNKTFYTFIPQIKISCPAGIKLNIEKPDLFYCDNVSKSYHENPICYENIDNHHVVAAYIIYSQFKINTFFDLIQFRRFRSTQTSLNILPLFNITFTPIYYFGSHQLIDNINYVIINNDEVYKNFDEIFTTGENKNATKPQNEYIETRKPV